MPPFDDLIGPDDPDRDRLLAADRLLRAAGAPPELPPSLEATPPEPRPRVLTFPRRHRPTVAAAAIAIAAALLLGIGYTIGGRNSPPQPVRTVAMTGASGATASIALLPKDAAGNWPMTLQVSGLAPLPEGKTYTLWLTRGGKLAESCGTFVVAAGSTKVPLNAPYRLKQFDGWVIARTGSNTVLLSTA
jgi:Anti-sigma-K factor rskA, C-terminal